MKNLIFLFGLFFLPKAFSQQEDEPVQPISFELIETAIHRVFPEAHQQFLTISFMRRTDFILPESATFLIPDHYFKKKIDQNVLEKRAELLMDQLELSPACQSISFGDIEEYSFWSSDDNNVRKVTFWFGIGC